MRYRKFRQQQRSLIRQAPGIFVLGGLAVAGAVYSADTGMMSSVGALAKGCDVKGNISLNGGARIYHMPGQEDYAATRISLQYGERWFCTEAEAVAAGWRKARN
ncbi:succinoglycan biosynthesis protein exoi [Rhizobium sp. ARZ01]|uniref:sunset domain-containing protein n=1 Tax=Rhizobium sp. ARZ01 TaxID=2769313 RepID=UPI001786C925|nr:succinoglycan biosynthesis protein exoi [Rhizobium sp. ARZ01]MBD9373448.1 succinoglycan biosynthesis protein exoi [Rhizobium sp. ARZ01]